MTRIKICGITRFEDARAAVELGAHALGFIFVPSSPRYLGAGDAAERIVTRLPPFVEAVFVCRNLADYRAHPCASLFHTVQIYEPPGGDQVPCGMRIIAATRVRDEHDVAAASAASAYAQAVLLDAYDPNALGGTGTPFDWRNTTQAAQRLALPVILAGGLTPENVGEAIRMVRPYAVDVSSGVEAAPGRKDIRKMTAFFAAVRHADRELD
ncbi:MAG: phosphoribosylanthranilate isomerase [Chthonomonadales bacterium]